MFKAILPAISAIGSLLGWWLFFSRAQSFWWILIVSLLLLLITAKQIAGRFFWQYKLSWLNIVFIYLGQTLFLLLLKSSQLRYGTAFWLAVAWGFIWWSWQQYFRKIKTLLSPDYFSFNRFWYYLNLWFLASGIYALLVFINLPLIYALLGLLLVAGSFLAELLIRERLFTWRLLFLWTWLFAQVIAVIALLPVSFYLAGILMTLWYFFLTEAWLNVDKKWHWYPGLLLMINIFTLLMIFIYL